MNIEELTEEYKNKLDELQEEYIEKINKLQETKKLEEEPFIKEGQNYYYIDGRFHVFKYKYNNDIHDNNFISVGNCYPFTDETNVKVLKEVSLIEDEMFWLFKAEIMIPFLFEISIKLLITANIEIFDSNLLMQEPQPIALAPAANAN